MDEFRSVQAELKPPGVRGWWVKVLEELDEERREQLEAAAGDREIMHRTISVVLERWGYPVSVGQVAHWRRNHVR
ncbi:MAG TPA: hypothetical protein VIG24_11530 [Acidimicrobiia bacterium]